MNHFKNKNNEIFGYDDEQVAQGYGADLVAVTDAEAKLINTNRGKEEEEERFNALPFSGKRAEKYPSIGDQLDMQYHDQINNTTTWKDAIEKIKADNPKPE
jgi:uncharacterized protein with von Willebrand factor type A (vWA) domain|tara:strand:- start:149 stop:451 length:303 start_codon:yes stop_codon:yes gene_type:complete